MAPFYPGISPTVGKYIVLADGENLVFGYQKLAETRKRNPNAKHIQDVFIWHQNVISTPQWFPLRVNYYTSVTGDHDHIADVEKEISKVEIAQGGSHTVQMCPRVFKKENKSKRSRLVDISICIDALRHSHNRDVGAILVLSGDGDYLPLIQEVMRNGTQVWLMAFSDGLNPALPRSVDRFIELDRWFFND